MKTSKVIQEIRVTEAPN